MVFSSAAFLYFFLPVVLGLYFAAPDRWKNLILLLASLFFYCYGEPAYCPLLLVSSFLGYLHGIWIGKTRGTRCARIALISSIVTITGLLVFFKYTNFFIKNLNIIAHTKLPLLKIALPLGISFYSFQILSYTIDLYRGRAGVQRSFLNFATYVAMFPQLIAGPIVRYTTVEKELARRSHTLEGFARGVSRFVTGLSKKVLIANTLGELGDIFTRLEQPTVLFCWLTVFAFMLQIYFDFSGYSDMAIGLGRIFGFHFPENFNYPYISRSITEFWRRWHISLSSWFRDYVYIPMGGNRVPAMAWMRNIFIVWFLVGFWHGAAWNYIIWGLFFAVFLILEKCFIKRLLGRLPSFFAHLYALFFLTLSFAIFNAEGPGQGMAHILGMFGFRDVPLASAETIYYLKSYLYVFLVAVIGATPLPAAMIKKIRSRETGEKIINLLEPAANTGLLLLSTAYLINGSFNPFLYFRF